MRSSRPLGRQDISKDAGRLRVLIGTAGVPGAATDHGGLTGLGDDDHPQYVHISAPRTITGQHTFAPGSAQPPFVLGANAQSQLVTGLRADQLNKQVIAGAGLITGGTLTTDVTLNVAAGAGITVNADDVALTTPGTLSISTTNSAAGNHTHAITASSNPGATEALLKSSAAGYLQLVRLGLETSPSYPLHIRYGGQQIRVEYDASNFANLTVGGGGNLTVAPSGDFVFDPAGNDIMPETGYDLNIGSLSRKYLTLHAAELWVETLVAQETIATIGGRILVGPTTILEVDLAA